MFINNEILTIDEMSRMTELKNRSIYNYIKEINIFLQSNNYNPIESLSTVGFYLNVDIENLRQFLLSTNNIFFNTSQRCDFIMLSILVNENKLNMDYFAHYLNASKITISNDLKHIKLFLKTKDLDLSYNVKTGFIIIGEEIKKRLVMINLVTESYDLIKTHLDPKIKTESRLLVKVTNQLFERDLTDQFVNFLETFIAVLATYYKNKKFITLSVEDKDLISKTNESKLVTIYLNWLESLYPETDFKDEGYYFSILVIASSFRNKSNIHEFCYYQELKDALFKSFKVFERESFCSLENKEQLANDMIYHIVPAFYRTKFNIHINNPDTAKIDSKYGHLKNITKISIEPVEEVLNIKFLDDEMAYLTLYFAANFFNNSTSRIDTVLVCKEGLGVSYVLCEEIKMCFPEINIIQSTSASNLSKIKKNYSLVLSTYPIENNKIYEHYLKINTYLSHDDKQKLRWIINLIHKNKNGNIKKKNILDILVCNEILDYKKGIELAGSYLLENYYIEYKYIKVITDHITNKTHEMAISPNILLCHGNPKNGVLRVGITLTTFTKGLKVPGYEKPIKMIVFLAPSSTLEHLEVMNYLIKIILNEKKFKKIISLDNSELIYNYIKEE